MNDANDRIETNVDELRFEVSNLVMQVEHMEAHLAIINYVVRTFAANESYIGSVAAVAPMGFAFIRREGPISVDMNLMNVDGSAVQGSIPEIDSEGIPLKMFCWGAGGDVGHWHLARPSSNDRHEFTATARTRCKFVAMCCVSQVMCSVG